MRRFKTEYEYLNAVKCFFSLVHEKPIEFGRKLSEFSLQSDDGFALFCNASDCFQFAQDIRESKRVCREDFDIKRLSVAADYSLHRKLAKRLFKLDKLFFEELLLHVSVPSSYHKKLLFWRTFYETTNKNKDAIRRFEKIGISQSKIHSCMDSIREMRRAYLDYKQEDRLSLSATKKKSEALRDLHQWMLPVSSLLISSSV